MAEHFRCSVASLTRSEPQIGTASTVRAYFLLEQAGAWGREVLRDGRLPDGVRVQLESLHRQGVKVLLMRRHGRSSPRHHRRVFAVYAGGATPWIETTVL